MLMSSKDVQQILSLVLTFGNYMNGGGWQVLFHSHSPGGSTYPTGIRRPSQCLSHVVYVLCADTTDTTNSPVVVWEFFILVGSTSINTHLCESMMVTLTECQDIYICIPDIHARDWFHCTCLQLHSGG